MRILVTGSAGFIGGYVVEELLNAGHQVVGLSMEEYRIPVERAYDIVRKAEPFRDLTMEKFKELCMFLERLRLVWLDDKLSDRMVIKRRQNAFTYYYNNLSTIPDVRNYRIIDITTNTPVGSLDAEFIALHGSPGTSFIVKGQAWKILEVRKGSVIAEPQRGIEAAIPAWEGELIPVPFEVAQGVGRLRREIAEKLGSRNSREAIKFIVERYPVTEDVAKKMVSAVKKQKSFGHVPDDREILIEHYRADQGYWVIIHTCFGSLVNETIGRVMTVLLSNRLGSIGLQTDPYRIMLKLQVPRWNDAIDTFRYLETDSIESILDVSMVHSELFTWRFIHVAKRMGIIERDADYGKGYIGKVVQAYTGTPVYKEAMNEIKREKLDIGLSKTLLSGLHKGERKLTIKAGLSHMGELGLTRKFEIVAPDKPEHEIMQAFANRLMSTKLRLICSNCGEWALTARVKEEPPLQCPKCSAKTIGVTRSWDLETQGRLRRHLKGESLGSEDRKDIEDLLNTATLVMNYGQDALKALAGRGVGWTTAKRILASSAGQEDLLKKILDAERKFTMTNRFWKE